jgi:hypothetical protein
MIDDYLRAAEAGQALDIDGSPYTPAGLRRLRRSLAPVQAAARSLDLSVLDHDAAAPERLGRQVVEHERLPPSRLGPIVAALRSVCAFAVTGAPATPATEDRSDAPEPLTPTYAMLALGAHVGAWTERIIVIAFVLTAIGLALELV